MTIETYFTFSGDKDFLNILNAVRTLLDSPAQSRSNLVSSNLPRIQNRARLANNKKFVTLQRNPFGVNQLTDDDKNKFPKPAKT